MTQPEPGARRMLFLYVAQGAVFALIAARGLTVPLYAHELGASRFAVGALFSVATLAAAALSLPSGVLVDRFGARTLILVSIGLTGVSQVAIALTPSVAPIFLWQAVGGIGAGIQQSAIFSAVTESVPRSRVGRAMGWLTMAMQVGFFVGPALAGLALRWIDVRTDIGVTTALLIFTIPGALAASRTRQHSGAGLAFRAPLRALVGQAAFVPVVLALVGMQLAWGTVSAFLPVFGREQLGLTSSQIGYLLAIQAVVNGASRIPAGRLIDRSARRWPVLFIGATVWLTVTVVLGYLTGFLVPAIVLAVGTPFLAVTFVGIGVEFAHLAAESTRGVAMGMYGTILFLGLATGPLLFGPIVQSRGYGAGFTAAAVSGAVLLVAMAVIQVGLLRRRNEPALLGDSETRGPATRQA